MTGVHFEYSEVRRLAAAFVRVPEETLVGARTVIQRGALNIKKDWRQRWQGHARYLGLPSAINYDTKQVGPVLSAEIGVDKSGPQGGLGNIIEFGTKNNAPNPGGLPALEAEAPRFEAAVRALTERLP